jgi:hypothetical protein
MILYHPAARREYDRQVARLMKNPFTTRVVANFIEEIETAERAILRDPDRFPLVSGLTQYRRFGPTKIYRFNVIDQIAGSDLHVLAVAHPARRPRYWIKRRIL